MMTTGTRVFPRKLMITVSYLGPTDTNGSRVKLTLSRFKKSRTFPFDSSAPSTEMQAAKALNDSGILIEAGATLGDKDLFIVDWPLDFKDSNLSKFFKLER